MYIVNKGKVRSLLPADFLMKFGKNCHGRPEMLMKKLRFPSTFLESGDQEETSIIGRLGPYAPRWKKSPPSKTWDPVKTPLFENLTLFLTNSVKKFDCWRPHITVWLNLYMYISWSQVWKVLELSKQTTQLQLVANNICNNIK